MGTFSMKLNGKAAIVLQRAEELAKSHGVRFQHNGRSGSFSHLGVKGAFTITKNMVEVKYTKPIFISDAMVENQIKQILG
jgi:hypothetical protein